jgi:hypothetical protein
MKNAVLLTISLICEFFYNSIILINSLLKINLFNFGTFSDQSYFDIGGKFEQEQYKKQTAIESYRALARLYSEILDVAFHGISSKDYTKPDFWLSLEFSHILKKLKIYQEETLIKDLLPIINFNDYINFNINIEYMIANYPQKRKEILDYRALIENIFIYECKVEGNLSEHEQRDIKYTEEMIREYKIKRGIIKSKNKFTLQFTAHNSDKKKVFKVLDDNIDQWMFGKVIINKSHIKKHKLYGIIYQLRKSIIKQDLNTKLKIENRKKTGEYKLTTLAS